MRLAAIAPNTAALSITAWLAVCAAMSAPGMWAQAQPARQSHRQSSLAAPQTHVLTRVRDVRSLDPARARAGLPVRLTGVVTAFSGYKNSFFFADATDGISIDRTDHADVQVGDRVEVTGSSGAGFFAPVVLAGAVRAIGHLPMPQARRVTYGDLMGGNEDAQWIEVRGVVHGAHLAKSFGHTMLFLDLQLGGDAIQILLSDYAGMDADGLIDALVTIRGVCFTEFNSKRQFIGVGMNVPSREDIHIEQAADADPFAIALTPIHGVLQFGQASHRVKVAGTVTYQNVGHSLYLQDGSDGIRVQTSSTIPLPAGTRVEAVGFPVLGDYAPVLKDGFFRVTGHDAPVNPLRIDAGQIIPEHMTFNVVPYDEQLLQLQGRVVESHTQAGKRVWILEQDDKTFEAALPLPAAPANLKDMKNGSILLLTGICVIHTDSDRNPTSFSLLLRSAEDIVVLKPTPWWTPRNVLLLLGTFSLLTGTIVFWVLSLRNRVKKQTQIIRESEARYRDLAQKDALTGLPNRLLLDERMAQCIAACKADDYTAAVLTVDIDRFKQINDTYGHSIGDECLKEVARRLSVRVRHTDLIARTGGEEFTLVLGSLKTAQTARNIAADVLALFVIPIFVSGLEIALTVSVGVALYPDDGSEADTLRKRSEQALFEAKRTGRNRVVFATEELSTTLATAVAIETALREGLRLSKFVLNYQPIYDAAGSVRHFEALLRTTDENLSKLGPAKFIPVAEESGLILPLGRWVMEEACRQIALWQQLGFAGCPVNVNVSARQLVAKGFVQDVLDTLKRFNINPSMLEIELTETTAMTELTSIAETVSLLARAGVTFAIDDFGTGYSSLSRLHDLAINTLKIDRSFVMDLGKDSGSYTIVRAIIQMAKSMHVQVVAEGVENHHQFDMLQELGCDFFQGYLFARAMTSDAALTTFLASHPAPALLRR